MNQEGNPFPSLNYPWDHIFPTISRITVWGILAGILYILRSFFLLIFFTFVFSYIQASGVKSLEKWIKNRTKRVILVAAIFLTLLITVGIFLVPKVKYQTQIFVKHFSVYISRVDQELYRFSEKYPILQELIPELHKEEHDVNITENKKNEVKVSPTSKILQEFAGFGEEATGQKNVTQALDILAEISQKIVSISSAFFLSMLFSFLIVLDLPKLSMSVADLKNTKLRFIYIEVADTIRDFSHILGKALEAQLIIALLNTILTAIGISILGIGKNVAFLSVIVFFFCFIPVVGVFISSIPICLIALQTSGLHTMIYAIILIIIIHLIEGYFLNPRIYGSYMRINPVIILIILTIGGKLFHFWGLILGVPVFTYVFSHAIRIKEHEIK